MILLLKRIGYVILGLIGMIGLVFLLTSNVVREVDLEKTIYIDVSREELWKITALDFGGNSKWDAGVNISKGRGDGINGSVCTERACHVAVEGIDQIVERLVEYDAENYRFKYEGTEGMPSMIESGTNEWIHEIKGEGTQMTMHASMRLKGLMGMILKGTMEKRVGIRIQEALEELKVYAETGKQHPRKKAAMAKHEKELETSNN